MKQHTEQSELDNWRKQIDAVDDHIITLLAMRMDIVQQVGEYKKANNIAARDENRWQSLLNNLIKKGKAKKLPTEIITQIYTAIHEYSVDKQRKMSL